MKKFSTSFTVLKSFLLLFLLALPFFGSDCNNTTTQNTGNITGTWTLNFIQGNLQDVCIGEVMVLPSNTGGTATLTCPGQNSISSDYTFSNDVLTYTSSGITYSVNSSSSTLLILTGTFTSGSVTNTRILTYKKPSSNDSPSVIAEPENGRHNSSEKILSK